MINVQIYEKMSSNSQYKDDIRMALGKNKEPTSKERV